MVGFLSNQVELELWFELDTGPPSANSFALEYVWALAGALSPRRAREEGEGSGDGAVKEVAAPSEKPRAISRIEKGDV